MQGRSRPRPSTTGSRSSPARTPRASCSWYAGSFCIGALAGAADDARSLGFVSETERQVEAHLRDHLRRLPQQDKKSAAILARMSEDEAQHGTTAALAGGTELPALVSRCMTWGGEILRRVALYV
jgi:ubiquinone biosynthesis monooxygenase Coq7